VDYLTIDEWEKIHSGDFRTFNEVLSRIHNSAVETAMKMTPEITAALIKNSLAIHKIREKFYDDNPEFLKNKDLVQKIVQEVESSNPGADYQEILRKSTPLIKEKLSLVTSTTKQLDMFNKNRPDLNSAFKAIGGIDAPQDK
jgi:hypothetical protein